MNIKQRVKIVCEIAGMNLGDVGFKMGMSQSTFSTRLKTGKFTKEELMQMAEILNCRYISYFKFDDNIIIAETTGDEIRKACAFCKISLSELARQLGMTQPSISRKLKTGKFKHDELYNIAKVITEKFNIRCNYEAYFEFDNGVKV